MSDHMMPAINRATLNDIPAMAAMLAELFTLESDFHPDTARQTQGLTALLNSADAAIFVARDRAGHPIAMIAAQLIISTAQGTPSVWIEDVFVTQPHRGKGLGSHLLDAVQAWAKSRGATRMQLLVDIDNTPAVAFYEKQGWETTRLSARRKMI